MNYEELVKALRCCGNVNTDCTVCPWDKYNFGMCAEKLYTDAAAAIEELDAEETRLLLITSELQDKVVELEEELNDADIAADDNARQVEELQAEVEELKAKKMKLAENSLRFVGKVRELDKRRFEPKRGKWKVDMSHFSPHIVCSVCGVEIPCVAGWCMDAHMNYCPNCGAKMEVQE